MKRLCLITCLLLFGVGCEADGNKGQWDEFWKDLRGDNMRMSSEPARTTPMGDQPAKPPSSN
jgi:hypothetical protein